MGRYQVGTKQPVFFFSFFLFGVCVSYFFVPFGAVPLGLPTPWPIGMHRTITWVWSIAALVLVRYTKYTNYLLRKLCCQWAKPAVEVPLAAVIRLRLLPPSSGHTRCLIVRHSLSCKSSPLMTTWSNESLKSIYVNKRIPLRGKNGSQLSWDRYPQQNAHSMWLNDRKKT